MKDVKKRMIQIIGLLGVLLVLVIIVNVLYIVLNGTSVPTPTIERKEVTIGTGEQLNYLIVGDSTTVAQGGDYDQGYVVKTAETLAQNYTVTYANYGVSGATIGDVFRAQLPNVPERFKPDIVLVGAGANDVTHLTSLGSVRTDLESIIKRLREMNPDVVIIFTGAASMGDVKRFPQPIKWLAGVRTKQINGVFREVTNNTDTTFAAIAEATGSNFATNPQYFAKDNFHPSNEGYADWTRVLNKVIASSLSDNQ